MKQFKILWLLIAIFALAACGGNDDEDAHSAKIDSAIIGTWVKTNPNDNHEINEAFQFNANGNFFAFIGGVVECYGGTFYTENGVVHAVVKPGKIADFKSIDNFGWLSISSEESKWDLKYSISGDNIKLTRLQDNQSWSLQKYQTSK